MPDDNEYDGRYVDVFIVAKRGVFVSLEVPEPVAVGPSSLVVEYCMGRLRITIKFQINKGKTIIISLHIYYIHMYVRHKEK